MRARTTSLLSLATLFVLALAHAAPPVGKGGADPGDSPKPGPGGKKVLRAPSRFAASRLGQTVTKNGTTLTRKQILEKFDPDAALDVGNGTKITSQELMDRLDEAEDELTKKGSSLTSLKKTGFMRATTAAKITSQQATLATEQADTKAKKMAIVAGVSAYSCTPQTCKPRDKEKTVKWEKVKGDEDTVAVYSSINVTEQTASADDAKCTATWDNGIHLIGSKQSLIKLTAEAAGLKKPSVVSSGKVALYVLGQASPTWSKEGKITAENLDRTFKSPKVSLDIPFIPFVTVSGGIQAAATLSLRPTVGGFADATHAGCNLSMTPRVTAEVDPEVKITVGIRKIAELASGGVRAQITALDVSVPMELAVGMNEQQPLGVTLKFKSDLKASFLKGQLVAWYKFKDLCVWGYCLIEDGLGIDTSGEVILWKDDAGSRFEASLADFNGTVPFVNPAMNTANMIGP